MTLIGSCMTLMTLIGSSWQLYIGTSLSTLAHQVASIESCTRRVHNWLLNNGLHLNPDVAGIVTSFGLGIHLYADDTQLHDSCLASDEEALSRLDLCSIEAVRLWMASNRLRLNPDKTQFVWLGTREQLAKRNCDRLSSVSPTPTHTSGTSGLSWTVSCWWGTTSHSYVVPVFSSCVVCVRFATLLLRNRFSCSRTASLLLLLLLQICSQIEVPEHSNCRLVPYWREFLGVSGSRTWSDTPFANT